jgi:hypothetical protein
MSAVPPGLILANNDLTDNVKAFLIKQLHINIVMTGEEFDAMILSDPNYPAKVKELLARLLVIRNFQEFQNRELFDLVIFIKTGLAAVLKNNYGPLGITLPVLNLTWGKLGYFGPGFEKNC